MERTLKNPRVVAALTLAFVAGAGAMSSPSPLEAQDGDRYRVLVPNFVPEGGARDNFGKDVTKEIRKRINDMATHRSYEGGDLRDALRKYGLKEEDLAETSCIKARQLATQEGVNLVLCGRYSDTGSGMQVNADIISPVTNETFAIQQFAASDPRQAADEVVQRFEQFTQVLATTAYCAEYVTSSQWENAIEACDRALAVDPNAKNALYYKATSLYWTEQKQEALDLFRRVLDMDEGLNQDALKFAGIIATELGQTDEGRRYFEEYLALNPGDSDVRLQIAQEMAKAGDYEGALVVVEEGMTGDSVSIDLKAYAGGLALQAAEEKRRAYQGAGAEGEVPEDAKVLYQKAIDYLEPVLDAKGSEAEVGLVRNMMVAYTNMGNTQGAAELGERATRLFPDDATLWIVHAQNLKAQDDLDGALAALDRAKAADPEARVNRNKVAWLLEAGRIDDAAAPARAAVDAGEIGGAELAEMIAGMGWNEKGKNNQHNEAIKYYELAKELAPTAQARAMPNFFHGYAVFQQAIAVQEPSTAASAQRALPMFRRAKELLEAAAGYQQQEQTRQTLISQVNDYIEIQDALIRRGR